MWSEYSLEVVDAVARTGSFSAAAQELHRVPSAVSYTVRQLENWLAVPLFERRHRDVELTEAGAFLSMRPAVLSKNECHSAPVSAGRQRLARSVPCRGGSHRPSAALPAASSGLYRHFPDMELMIHSEVFNGVWDALINGRVEVAIGATRAVPAGGRYAFRDMGFLRWRCVVSPDHPLAAFDGEVDDDRLRPFPALSIEDTSRTLPKRDTWLLDNQRRLVAPDWPCAIDCLEAGLCVGLMPAHAAEPLIAAGRLHALRLCQSFPDSACCVTWQDHSRSPALEWLLEYLGDTRTMNQEWLMPQPA
ncbi:DNA-binding transcriptional activator PunR [Edwardsiella anguillarum]|nr:DNA-binding transcriptional activator PunR [Edwardsiella anguillarum]